MVDRPDGRGPPGSTVTVEAPETLSSASPIDWLLIMYDKRTPPAADQSKPKELEE